MEIYRKLYITANALPFQHFWVGSKAAAEPLPSLPLEPLPSVQTSSCPRATPLYGHSPALEPLPSVLTFACPRATPLCPSRVSPSPLSRPRATPLCTLEPLPSVLGPRATPLSSDFATPFQKNFFVNLAVAFFVFLNDQETDKAAFLVRQHIHYSLYDRIRSA